MARNLGTARVAAALLAALVTVAGAPSASCAAMPDCPAMAPATSCRGPSHGERHCAPTRLEANDECCAASAASSLPAAAIEKLTAQAGVESPLAAAVTPSLPAPSRGSMPALSARPLGPSGRALLSLHHTLLI